MSSIQRLIALVVLVVTGMTASAAAQTGDIVATVNGDPIPREQFHARVRFVRWQYVREIEALYEATGGNLVLTRSGVIARADSLDDPVSLGDAVLYQMEEERVLWQQGEALGLVPTAEDAQEEEAEFFSRWTNVPVDQLATNATAQTFIETWYAGAEAASGMMPNDIRILFETEALRERLFDYVAAGVPREELAVHTQHILCAFHPDNVTDLTPPTAEQRAAAETCAETALIRLAGGEPFAQVALELSDDPTSAQDGGDVGWQFVSYLAEPYAEAAQDAELNTVIGPVETIYGLHVIEVLEREMRELPPEQYAQSQQGYFALWTETLHAEAGITRAPDWDANIPTTPGLDALDPEIAAAVADLRGE